MNELTHGVSSDVPPHTNRKAPATWHQHDWRAIHRGVKRLQVRIAKAAQLGRMRELRNLQRLLSHSYHAKLLAVKRVTENRGKKTPGVDGVRWSTPQDKSRAVEDLNQAGYKPQPLRRVWILKRDGKSKRPLGIPTMKDRAMQALHLLTLEPVAETTGDLNSYGFRRFRCCQDAIEQAFRVLAGRNSAQWVLNADIQACFDALAHDWLLSHIPMNHSILRKWLKAGILEDGVFQNTDRGTPQGGVISPCLMNMALDGLERTLHQAFRPKGRNPDKVNFIRYADDFIITGARRELLQEQVTARLRDFLGMRGLRLSEQKTTITKIEEGSDFLSFNLRKYRGKLLIKPARSAIKGIQQKIRAILATRKAARAVDVIAILNPILRGWAQYHRHVVSKEIFKALDHWLWGRIWRWSCRRHTRKSATWIRQKYFCHHEGKNWVFFGRVEDGKELRGRVPEKGVFWGSTVQARRVKWPGQSSPRSVHISAGPACA